MGCSSTEEWEDIGLKTLINDYKSRHNMNNEYYRVIKRNGSQYLRYIKPIFVRPECLMCHGNEHTISGEIMRELNNRYPFDKARNYSTGDLIGGVSIQMKLN